MGTRESYLTLGACAIPLSMAAHCSCKEQCSCFSPFAENWGCAPWYKPEKPGISDSTQDRLAPGYKLYAVGSILFTGPPVHPRACTGRVVWRGGACEEVIALPHGLCQSLLVCLMHGNALAAGVLLITHAVTQDMSQAC